MKIKVATEAWKLISTISNPLSLCVVSQYLVQEVGGILMDAASNTGSSLALSYLSLRRMIGIIGIALPFVLIFGRMILESPGILNSISGYYYSVMRGVFVGSLWAVGIFLLSYRGYNRSDDTAGDVAYVAAIGVSLFRIDFG
jgi:hypothetical protein